MRGQSRARDMPEPVSSGEEAEGWSTLRADNFTTTIFSGTPGDLSEKTWWLFCMLARERRTDFQPSPTAASFQLPMPPWTPCRGQYTSSDVDNTPNMPGHIQVPLLHFKQDAFNFIKRNLGSPSKETGDSVMATISCLMLIEAAFLETNPDALSAVVMHLNGLVTAANHYCGSLVTAELTVLQRFLGICVSRDDVQEQLLSTVSNSNQRALRCMLFIGLSPKPADAWWCTESEEQKSANPACVPASLLRETRGQQQVPGFASARMIAYMYLSLVLRPGRISNEVLMCLVDSVGTDIEGLVQRGITDFAEQAISFWNVLLSGAAIASLTPSSGRGLERLGRKQRLNERSIRDLSAMLHLQTWPEAVNMLKTVAYVEIEGEQELRDKWERAVSDVGQCA
ncbi:hypothetical protein DHEL01_v208199 [Diaporthe helianthi]|uniref:Uncharacterized protein n=1 Tax=Diaporthe helianthi TaxID=158607 RepID=A0A2P5HT31_DIAHE|nr:hypothetical protein DHEL01_v208199 [Diaporthe helianthi]